MAATIFGTMDVREKLLTAALKVFEEAGSRGATTRRIASEAGVNEITLFRHFGSKAALMSEALACASAAPVESCLPAEPLDPARELLAFSRVGYQHLRRNAAMIRTAMGEMEQAPEAARCVTANPVRVHEQLKAYLGRLQEGGMASRDWDPHAASAMLMGTLFSDAVGRDMMPEKYPYPEAEAPARYVSLFLRAIGVAAPAEHHPAEGSPVQDP
jgi:AcrR family transcriptional regulator